jgi:putative oxygen-independent coproporphyrinogen III oxidase
MFHVKQSGDIKDWEIGGFGLYIHWPFCQSKCPYCDFNSHVAAKIDQNRWRDAYLAEIRRAGLMTPGRTLQTVFFGGGTPSLMSPDLIDAVITEVRRTWRTVNDIEITMEANPGSVEAGRFLAYRQAGVTRISIGVQALNDQDLKSLGRLHSVEDAMAALQIAQSTFDRTSFDLIYGRQNQSLGAWQDELRLALSIASGHLSLYQLTIEDGTAFGDRFKRGRLRGLPDEDLGADLYLATRGMTLEAGYNNYEVSNYAKEGQESRHNCIYWDAGDYIGIGPGAHGRLTLDGGRIATEAFLQPGNWLNAVEHGKCPEDREVLSQTGQGLEYLIMGLRRETGIDYERFKQISGAPLPEKKISTLRAQGMVEVGQGRLFATDKGRMVLNAVIESLVD